MSARNIAICIAFLSQIAIAAADIDYTVTIKNADGAGQRMTVSLSIPVKGAVTEVQSPNWGPGSYSLGDFYRNIQDVTVTGDGKELTANKPNDYTWSIP